MLPIRTILHPTDFSSSSQAAFEYASGLARDYGATLVITHVEPLPMVLPTDGIALPPLLDEPEVLQARLEEIRPVDTTITVRHRLLNGDAAGAILDAATEEKADLIVLGTHGRGGLKRMLLGSVAEQVLRKAICPVLTVRGPLGQS